MQGISSEKKSGDRDGPLIIVAIIGTKAINRWDDTGALFDLEGQIHSLICDGVASLGRVDTERQTQGDRQFVLYGFAVLQSWSLNVDATGKLESCLLRKLRRDNARRSSPVTIQSRLKVSLSLSTPLNIETCTGNASRWWTHCSGLPMHCFIAATGERSVHSGMCEPFERIKKECSSAIVHWWPVHPRVAIALATGLLTSDFIVIGDRSNIWTPPLLPGYKALRQVTLVSERAINTTQVDYSDRQRAMGLKTEYTVDQKIADLNVALDLSTKKVCMKDHCDKVYALETSRGVQMPPEVVDNAGSSSIVGHIGRETRRRGFPRLDCAAMLANRELYMLHGPYFRFLATDKGPQQNQSIELLNTVEICVARSDVWNRALLDIDPKKIMRRKLPPCTMAHGGTDLPCTVWTLSGTSLRTGRK